jgi:hypothetical protein
MFSRIETKTLLLRWTLLATVIGSIGSKADGSQQPQTRIMPFVGETDTEYPYPAQEGGSGQKDPTAVACIQKATASSLVPDGSAIEVIGTLTSGSGNTEQHYPVTIAIDHGSRFRMDIQEPDGLHTLRISGADGKTKQGEKTTQEVEDVEFVNPLGAPSLLAEISKRSDAAVIDDGIFTVDNHSMEKVTVTLFQTRYGGPVAASFYFDSTTHMLEKAAFIEHSAGNRSLKSLLVIAYGDYRTEQSVLIPHKYTETMNGQVVGTVTVTSASITGRHEGSYFSF